MIISESLKEAIKKERQQREVYSDTDLMLLIGKGEEQEAVDNLIFFTSPDNFLRRIEVLVRNINCEFDTVDEKLRESYLRFLVELTLSLRSFLPHWNLQNSACYGDAIVTDAQLEAETDKIQALAIELAAQVTSVVAERLRAEWLVETVARYRAENVSSPAGEARKLLGNTLAEYLSHISAELSQSNLRQIVEMRDKGLTITEISNDYAAFTRYARYLGASFVTTNPPLVDWAWTALPDYWTPIVDDIIRDNSDADDDALARLVTLEVVLSNMRLMRPIFLLTTGQMGCVTLQVNPHQHGNAETMISDALFYYEALRSRLNGGVPNVVFKLPGTKAGLTACRALTDQGIGVTITVNFAMFQHLAFAQAIQEGQAIFSCLAHMNGRLAYPVRDELLGKLDELAVYGLDEAKVREAAAWSGVAVLKRLQEFLVKKSYNLTRIKPLVASLRIYEGDGYDNLPNPFPDITETLGTSLISVFPNVRRPFDAQPNIELNPRQVDAPLPDGILETLAHSEIFKQAYHVSNPEWVSEEDERFRPAYELMLEDEVGTAAWTPVHDTLTQFSDSYDTFVQRILERKRVLLAQ